MCANRIFVQDSVYADFTKKLIHAVTQLKVGNGLEQGVQQGPLINEAAVTKVKTHIADALEKGAQLLLGGKPHALGGLFFQPTVLSEVNASMRLAQEETFGPVAPLFRFHSEEEVIELANATPFGLASYFYSNNMERIWRVAEGLECGMVGINTGIVSTESRRLGVKNLALGAKDRNIG